MNDVVAADLNGDGKTDIVTANESGPSDISVLLNNGAGGFAAVSHYLAGRRAQTVAVGDFNSDNKPDLIAANGSNVQGDLTVLFNNGSGAFPTNDALFITSPGINSSTPDVAVADFNGDGKADFAAATRFGVAIGLGDGAGHFTTKFFNSGGSVFDVLVADYNADGKPDVVTANGGETAVAVLLGDGAGNLGAPTEFTTNNIPASITGGDFNNDGKPDIAAPLSSIGITDFGPNVAVLLGNGTGGFAAPKLSSSGGNFMRKVAAGDLDGDGDADLAATNGWPGNVTVMIGNGAGDFTPTLSLEPLVFDIRGIVVSDFDADGRADLALGNFILRHVLVLPGLCASGPVPSTLSFSNLFGFEGQDTTVRLVRFGGIEGTVTTDYATSDDTATAGSDYTAASGSFTFAPGETLRDIPIGLSNDSLIEGSENFNLTLSNVTGATASAPNPASFLIVDDEPLPYVTINDVTVAEGNAGTTTASFNVALTNPVDAQVSVQYATAGGIATAGADYVAASGTVVFAPGETTKNVVITINGDTLPEISESFLVNLSNPVNAVLDDQAPQNAEGLGRIADDDSACPDASFGPATEYNVGSDAYGIVSADFNGDGHLDIANTRTTGTGSNNLSILLNNGTGGFSVGSTLALGNGPNAIVAGDFTGDGKLDLASTLLGSNAVAVVAGTGTGTFGAPTTFPVGTFTRHLAAADFNGDGKLDIATANAFSRNVSIILNNGTGSFGAPTNMRVGPVGTIPDSPVHISTADFNADGKTDLLIASTTSGNSATSGISVKLGDGAGGFTESQFFTTSGLGESTVVGDFNEDGKLDFALARRTLSRLAVFFGTGTGTFTLPFAGEYGTDFGPVSPVTADFNGDGNLDLATANGLGNSGTVSVLYGNGAGGFGPATDILVGQTPSTLSVADYNNDGRPDLAVTLFSSGKVVVLLNGCGNSPSSAIQFSAPTYGVGEDERAVQITVVRTGDATGEATVNYATSDDTASERKDYITALGTLSFAAGETSKTFTVLITDDAIQDAAESVNLTLSNASGASLGVQSTATLSIIDNDNPPPASNPIDDPVFFVRQHYHDFLNREPDAGGLNFWTGNITSCGSDAQCIQERRVNVSAAFFLSIEFQSTGYQVIRIYKSSFPDSHSRPRGLPRYREFLRDTQEVQRGVIVGQGDWAQRLQQNTRDFARRWVDSAEFTAEFPVSMTAEQFVDKLFQNSEVTPTQSERDDALAAFGAGGTEGRAAALLSVTNTGSVYNKQYNPAFVLMQYIGYLRRSPDDTPDTGFGGFNFWLQKLDEFSLPGEDVRNESVALARVRRAEMVRAFIESIEYRTRFAP